MLTLIVTIASVITPAGQNKASADVVTAYPQYLNFEQQHYGELISSGYVENQVMASQTTPGSQSGGWAAGTYHKYWKSIEAEMTIPTADIGKYRYWIVVEPSTSVYGNGGNGVTSKYEDLYASSDNAQNYNPIWSSPQNGQAIGASHYSVSTDYHVYTINGDFSGPDANDVATGSYYDISRIDYYPASSTTQFKYRKEWNNNYYETMKSVSYRVYRTYTGITQAPEITVSPSQNYHAGTNNTFTISKPTSFANTYEKTNGVLQYRLNGSTWKKYTGAVAISDEGQVEIESRLFTNGTLESIYGTAYSRQDNTPPTAPKIDLDSDKWYQSFNVVIAPGTDTGSGVAGVDYSLNGAITQPTTRLTGAPKLTTEGITTIKAVTADNVGLVSSEVSQQVKIDHTPPVGSLTASSIPAKSNVIKVSGTDNLAGLVFIGLPNSSWYNGKTLDYPITKNGTYTFRFQDAAENISSKSITISNIDSDLPTATFSISSWNWVDQDKDITISYDDPTGSSGFTSGVDLSKMYYKLTHTKAIPSSWDQASSTNQVVNVPEGQWYLHARVYDLAGNEYTTVSDLLQVQYKPMPAELTIKGIATDKISLSWPLPNVESTATDGYTFTLKNVSTGKSWTLDHPVNSMIDQDLKGGTEYDYTLQVKNHTGESIVSRAITGITLPEATSHVQVLAKDRTYDQATLQIDPVKSATGYVVTATDWVTGQVDVATTVSTNTYVTVSGLKPYVMYDFSVKALNSAGAGEAYHTSFLSLPDQVNGFKSVQLNQNSIDLNWNTVTGSTYHYSSVTSDTYYDLQRNNTGIYNGVDTHFLDEHLDSGTAYDYSVAAGNNTGMGAWSYLSQLYTLPAPVKNLKQISATTTTATIKFQQPVGADGYEVKVTGMATINITGNPGTIEIPSLYPGQTILVEIRPKNKSGYGAAESMFVTSLPDMPVDGTVLVNKIGENEATFVIPEVPGATNYELKVDGKTYRVTHGEYTISGLVGGKTYSYSVAAGNEAGYGKEATGEFLTLPVAPTNLRIDKHSPTSFTIVWNAVQSADRYLVRNKAGEVLATVVEPTYTATGLDAGSTSTLYIEAQNSTGSGKQAFQTWRTLPGLDRTDLNGLVTVSNIDVHTATLLWPAVPGADRYVVYDAAGQVVATTDQDEVVLSGMSSAAQFEGYTVVPVNSSGAGLALPVPTWITKPSDDYTTSYSSSKKKAVITLQHDLQHEEFVIMNRNEEVYRGKNKSIEVPGLFPDSTYTFSIWTENESGERSTAKGLEVHTSKEREVVNIETEDPIVEPITEPEVEAPPVVANDADQDKDQSKKSFIDINKSFAKGSITRLADLGIVQGTTDELYEPGRGTTRAEFMALLVRLTLSPEQVKSSGDQDLSFTDVDGWYVPELQAAIKAGIAKGYNEDEFRPNALIDREQASKMIAGALYGRLIPDADAVYVDDSLIADWATNEVRSLTANQIVEGFPDQTFRPKANLTRAEAAAVIDRSMNKGLISTPLSQ